MRTKRLGIKSIGFLLAFTMALTDVAISAPADVFSALSPKEVLLKDARRFEAPLDFSLLKDVHQGSKKTFIVHIQDAHANLSGQQNLAGTLDELMEKYKISLVLVEGGTRDDSLTPLKKLATPKEWKRLAKKFLMAGAISGEEYLNLTSERPMKIMGIEDGGLYRSSLEAYGKLAARREDILIRSKKVRGALEKLKKRFYPKDLYEYEKLGTPNGEFGDDGFEERFLRLAALAERSEKTAPILKSFTNIQALLGLKRREEDIDFDAANLEQAALFEEIAARGGKEDLRAVTARLAKIGNNRPSQLNFIESLLNTARALGAALERYPNLALYAGYLRGFQTIDFERLLDEYERLEDEVYRANLPEENARLIRSIDRYLGLLDAAWRIQMTTRQFEMFRLNEPDFSTAAYLAFVNRKLADFGYFDDLLPMENIFEEAKSSLVDFYESVGRRDEAFMRNAERILARQKQEVAVLIAGGYHTSNLKKLLAGREYSYAVLSPIVNSETDPSKYEKVLLEPVKKEIKTVTSGEDRAGRLRRTGAVSTVRAQALAENMGRLTKVMEALPAHPAKAQIALEMMRETAGQGARLSDEDQIKRLVRKFLLDLEGKMKEPAGLDEKDIEELLGQVKARGAWIRSEGKLLNAINVLNNDLLVRLPPHRLKTRPGTYKWENPERNLDVREMGLFNFSVGVKIPSGGNHQSSFSLLMALDGNLSIYNIMISGEVTAIVSASKGGRKTEADELKLSADDALSLIYDDPDDSVGRFIWHLKSRTNKSQTFFLSKDAPGRLEEIPELYSVRENAKLFGPLRYDGRFISWGVPPAPGESKPKPKLPSIQIRSQSHDIEEAYGILAVILRQFTKAGTALENKRPSPSRSLPAGAEIIDLSERLAQRLAQRRAKKPAETNPETEPVINAIHPQDGQLIDVLGPTRLSFGNLEGVLLPDPSSQNQVLFHLSDGESVAITEEFPFEASGIIMEFIEMGALLITNTQTQGDAIIYIVENGQTRGARLAKGRQITTLRRIAAGLFPDVLEKHGRVFASLGSSKEIVGFVAIALKDAYKTEYARHGKRKPGTLNPKEFKEMIDRSVEETAGDWSLRTSEEKLFSMDHLYRTAVLKFHLFGDPHDEYWLRQILRAHRDDFGKKNSRARKRHMRNIIREIEEKITKTKQDLAVAYMFLVRFEAGNVDWLARVLRRKILKLGKYALPALDWVIKEKEMTPQDADYRLAQEWRSRIEDRIAASRGARLSAESFLELYNADKLSEIAGWHENKYTPQERLQLKTLYDKAKRTYLIKSSEMRFKPFRDAVQIVLILLEWEQPFDLIKAAFEFPAYREANPYSHERTDGPGRATTPTKEMFSRIQWILDSPVKGSFAEDRRSLPNYMNLILKAVEMPGKPKGDTGAFYFLSAVKLADFLSYAQGKQASGALDASDPRAREMNEIYSTLADRLGFEDILSGIEENVYQALYPADFAQFISEKVDLLVTEGDRAAFDGLRARFSDPQANIGILNEELRIFSRRVDQKARLELVRVAETLQSHLGEGDEVYIQPRVKSNASIIKKLLLPQYHGYKVADLSDLAGIFVVVPESMLDAAFEELQKGGMAGLSVNGIDVKKSGRTHVDMDWKIHGLGNERGVNLEAIVMTGAGYREYYSSSEDFEPHKAVPDHWLFKYLQRLVASREEKPSFQFRRRALKAPRDGINFRSQNLASMLESNRDRRYVLVYVEDKKGGVLHTKVLEIDADASPADLAFLLHRPLGELQVGYDKMSLEKAVQVQKLRKISDLKRKPLYMKDRSDPSSFVGWVTAQSPDSFKMLSTSLGYMKFMEKEGKPDRRLPNFNVKEILNREITVRKRSIVDGDYESARQRGPMAGFPEFKAYLAELGVKNQEDLAKILTAGLIGPQRLTQDFIRYVESEQQQLPSQLRTNPTGARLAGTDDKEEPLEELMDRLEDAFKRVVDANGELPLDALRGRLVTPELQETYKTLYRKVTAVAARAKLTQVQTRLLQNAYTLAFLAHQFFPRNEEGQYRRIGAMQVPYIVHPVDVLEILAYNFAPLVNKDKLSRLDLPALVTALLHDAAFEDTKLRDIPSPFLTQLLSHEKDASSPVDNDIMLDLPTVWRMARYLSKNDGESATEQFDRLRFSIERESDREIFLNHYHQILLIKLADKLSSTRLDLRLTQGIKLDEDTAGQILQFLKSRQVFVKRFANFLYRSDHAILRIASLYFVEKFFEIQNAQLDRIIQSNIDSALLEQFDEKPKPTLVARSKEDPALWKANGIHKDAEDFRVSLFEELSAADQEKYFEEFWNLLRETSLPEWPQAWLKNSRATKERLKVKEKPIHAVLIFTKNESKKYDKLIGGYVYHAFYNNLEAIAVKKNYRGKGATHILIEDLRDRYLSERSWIHVATLPTNVKMLGQKTEKGYYKVGVDEIETVLSTGPTLRAGPGLLGRIRDDFGQLTEIQRRWSRAASPVAIFGSARIGSGHPYYGIAKKLGEALWRAGMTPRTGAGPAMMEAPLIGYLQARQAAGAAAADANRTQGVAVMGLANEDHNVYVEAGITSRHFIIRKLGLHQGPIGFVALPGGIGTLDELFEVWRRGKPLVLLGKDFWAPVMRVLQKQMRKGGLWERFKKYPELLITDSIPEALEYLKKESKSRAFYPMSGPAARAFYEETTKAVEKVSKMERAVTFAGKPRVGKRKKEMGEAVRLAGMLAAGSDEKPALPIRVASRAQLFNAVEIRAKKESWLDRLQAVLFLPENSTLSAKEREFRNGPNAGNFLPVRDESVHQLALTNNSHAYVFLPGDIATFNKLFDIAAIMQTGKTRKKPIILIGRAFWRPILDAFKERMTLGGDKDWGMTETGERIPKFATVNADDFDRLFTVTDEAEEAYAAIMDSVTGPPARLAGARLALQPVHTAEDLGKLVQRVSDWMKKRGYPDTAVLEAYVRHFAEKQPVRLDNRFAAPLSKRVSARSILIRANPKQINALLADSERAGPLKLADLFVGEAWGYQAVLHHREEIAAYEADVHRAVDGYLKAADGALFLEENRAEIERLLVSHLQIEYFEISKRLALANWFFEKGLSKMTPLLEKPEEVFLGAFVGVGMHYIRTANQPPTYSRAIWRLYRDLDFFGKAALTEADLKEKAPGLYARAFSTDIISGLERKIRASLTGAPAPPAGGPASPAGGRLATERGESSRPKGARLGLMRGFAYVVLINSLRQGLVLVDPSLEAAQKTYDTEWGKVRPLDLNDLSNYKGRTGLFYLARDIEIAIDKGLLNLHFPMKKLNPQRLNVLAKLERAPEDRLAVQRLQWRLYFRALAELKEHPDAYQGDQGQIALARKIGNNSIISLYAAFAGRKNKYDWTQIYLTLKDLDRVKKELDRDPRPYQGEEGLIALAGKMGINSIGSLYSSFGGRGNPYGWRSTYLTSGDMKMIDAKSNQIMSMAENNNESEYLKTLFPRFSDRKISDVRRLMKGRAGARLAEKTVVSSQVPAVREGPGEDGIRFAAFYGARLTANFIAAPTGQVVVIPYLEPAGIAFLSPADILLLRQGTGLTEVNEPVATIKNLAAEEIDRQIALEARQARVFERALTKLGSSSDILEGVIGIDLRNFSPQALAVLEEALPEFTAHYPHVKLYFMGSERPNGVTTGIWEASKAKRILITHPDDIQPDAGFVMLDRLPEGEAHPARPLLGYAAYLLGIRTHNNPQAVQVPDAVLTEVGRLAGNPSGARLTGGHIIGFAMGRRTPEVLAAARTYRVRAVKFIEAAVQDYRIALQALGQAA